jgi:uncharacterized membrane protein
MLGFTDKHLDVIAVWETTLGWRRTLRMGKAETAMHGRRTEHIPQLDLVRGLAIVLMIVNHAGIGLIDPYSQQNDPLAALVFLGSFAPVVFFFTTGFGVAIGRQGFDLEAFLSTLLKAALLVIADQFLLWKQGKPWGLDFLGFIAISTVMMTAIRAVKKSEVLCAVAIAIVLSARFVLGPWLRSHTHLTGLEDWLVGVRPVDNVSYPFSPWIVYPLIGYIAACRYQAIKTADERSLFWFLGTVASGSFLVAAIMDRAQAPFFRWGTMSLAFFVLSIGVASVVILAAWLICAKSSLATRALSLRGIASLAVVPIHYVLVELLVDCDIKPMGVPMIVVTMTALVVISVSLSRLYATSVKRWMVRVRSPVSWCLFIALALLSAVVVWMTPTLPAADLCAFAVGQLSITALLAARDQRRSAEVRDVRLIQQGANVGDVECQVLQNTHQK